MKKPITRSTGPKKGKQLRATSEAELKARSKKLTEGMKKAMIKNLTAAARASGNE